MALLLPQPAAPRQEALRQQPQNVATSPVISQLADIMSKRRLRWGYAFSALLAVIGAGIIRYDQVTDHFWTGLLLVQLSNISFAIGMVG